MQRPTPRRTGLRHLLSALAATTLLTASPLAFAQDNAAAPAPEQTVDCAANPQAEGCEAPRKRPGKDGERRDRGERPRDARQAPADAPAEAPTEAPAEAAAEPAPAEAPTETSAEPAPAATEPAPAATPVPAEASAPEPKPEAEAAASADVTPEEKPAGQENQASDAPPAPKPPVAATTETAPAQPRTLQSAPAAAAAPAPDAEPRRKERRAEDTREGDRRHRDGDHRDGDRKKPILRSDGNTLQFSIPLPNMDARVVIGTGANARVEHDDVRRLETPDSRVTAETLPNGNKRIVIDRPNGARVITVEDPDGNIIRRVRERPDGSKVVLIDNREEYRRERRRERVDLPPLRLEVPSERYIVEGRRANRDTYARTFEAAPVEQVERAYSLEEIRENERLRAKLRRVDLAVNFATGSAAIPADQFDTLSYLGETIAERLRQNPDDVFLIEGHTDAVGNDISNLRLSDARAESVALALTDYFDIPPENLVVQGYGEQYLKVQTQAANAENRRVAVRRITPLLRGEE